MTARGRQASRFEDRVEVRAGERLYFIAVGVLALWVGVWGYFIPTEVTKALPFEVPPLHARFLGAVYLSGVAILLLSMLSRRWDDVRDVPVMTAIWTGGLGLISLLHLDAFPGDRAQTWVWFGAYIVFPILALLLAWRHRMDALAEGGTTLPRWASRYLGAQGVALMAASAMLLLFPGVMVDVWPWPITRMLAQIYSAPLLAYGVGSLLLSRRGMWDEIRIPVVGMAVFGLLVLVASVIHRDLFSVEIADVLWFFFLTVISVTLAVLGTRALGAVRPIAHE
jgi:hypothetical protein